MSLDPDASHRAISRLAAQIRLDPVQTAAGIIRIADTAMSHALRVVSVQRGYDPSEFKLVAFGGAGPLHAVALAAEVGVPEVVVPPRPGLASAFGLLVADVRHDFSRTLVCRLDEADLDELNHVFDELAAKARSVLSAENMPPEQTELSRLADVRYVGQSYYLTIPFDGPLDAAALDGVRATFNEFHRATYGYAEPREPCELVNLRVAAVGRIKKPRVAAYAWQNQESGRRQVYFEDIGYLECPVVEAEQLGGRRRSRRSCGDRGSRRNHSRAARLESRGDARGRTAHSAPATELMSIGSRLSIRLARLSTVSCGTIGSRLGLRRYGSLLPPWDEAAGPPNRHFAAKCQPRTDASRVAAEGVLGQEPDFHL